MALQEVGKLPAHIVAHAMYWAAFTQAAHPAAGVGIPVRWHPTVLEVGRDIHSSGLGLALEYRSRASWWWSISPQTRTWTRCVVSSRGP